MTEQESFTIHITKLLKLDRIFFFLILLLVGCAGSDSNGGAGVDESNNDDPKVELELKWERTQVIRIEDAGGILTPRVNTAVDSSGIVHVVYFDDQQYPFNTINHLTWDMESKSVLKKEKVKDTDNSNSLGFAIDHNDIPVVAYQGGEIREAGSPEESDAMFSIKDDSWVEYTGGIGEVVRNPVFNDGLAGSDLSVAFDKAGDIHLCYQFRYEGIDAFNYAYPDLLYVKKNRSSMAAVVPEETVEGNIFSQNGTATLQNNAGSFCKIIMDSNDLPIIFYYAESNNVKGLRVARKEGGEWVPQWIETGVRVGWISDPLLDKDGRLAVAYYVAESDDGEKNYLKYANEQSSSLWNVEIVDDSIFGGKYSSLAFDSSGSPAIAYYAEETYTKRDLKDLKLARLDGNEWKTESVATGGDIGTYNGLWFDNNDSAIIITYSSSEDSIFIYKKE